MPSSNTVGEHFEQFIKEQVEAGRYASATDVVRDALRLLEEQERRRLATLDVLRDEIRKGLESGTAKPGAVVFTQLEGKYTPGARQWRSRD